MNFQIPSGYEDFVSSASQLLEQFEISDENKVVDEVKYNVYLDNIENFDLAIQLDMIHRLQQTILNEILKNEISDYSWHLEPLHLYPVVTSRVLQNSTKPQVYCYLTGNTKFGENIEDEWYIVYLFIKASRLLNNISIQVKDNDGEFLMIEASEAMFQASSEEIGGEYGPENITNRVWIRSGKMEVIPLQTPGKDVETGGMKFNSALQYLQTLPVPSAMNPFHTLIAKRTTDVYPMRSAALTHYALVILPSYIINLLTRYPALLGPCIQAFCAIESNKLSAALSKITFPPSPSSVTTHSVATTQTLIQPPQTLQTLHNTSLQVISLKFTRVLYAQLLFKSFKTPRKYHEWMRRMQRNPSTKIQKAFELGCRLTAGMELLYEESRQHVKEQVKQAERITEMQEKALEGVKQLSTLSEPLILQALQATNAVLDPALALLNTKKIHSKESSPDSSKVTLDAVLRSKEDGYFDILTHTLTTDTTDTLSQHTVSEEVVSEEEDDHLFHLFTTQKEGDKDDWLYYTPDEFDKEIAARMQHYAVPPSTTPTTTATPSATSTSLAAANDTNTASVTAISSLEATKESDEAKKYANEVLQQKQIEELSNIVNAFKDFLSQQSEYDGITVPVKSPQPPLPKTLQTQRETEVEQVCRDLSRGFGQAEDGSEDIDMTYLYSLLHAHGPKNVSRSQEDTFVGHKDHKEHSKEEEIVEVIAEGIATKLLITSDTASTSNTSTTGIQQHSEAVEEEDYDSDDEVPVPTQTTKAAAAVKVDKEEDDEEEDEEDSESDSEDGNSDDFQSDEDEEEEEEEEYSMEDIQYAMDKELFQENALANTFNTFFPPTATTTVPATSARKSITADEIVSNGEEEEDNEEEEEEMSEGEWTALVQQFRTQLHSGNPDNTETGEDHDNEEEEEAMDMNFLVNMLEAHGSMLGHPSSTPLQHILSSLSLPLPPSSQSQTTKSNQSKSKK